MLHFLNQSTSSFHITTIPFASLFLYHTMLVGTLSLSSHRHAWPCLYPSSTEADFYAAGESGKPAI